MIFLTVGGEKYPFDRLVRAIDEAVASGALTGPVFGQVGSADYLPVHYPCARYLEFPEMVHNIDRAEIVIAHAGVGTVLLALSRGKIPVIFPRRPEFGEHLDDHQVEFARRAAGAGKVLSAEETGELINLARNFDSASAARPSPGESLKENLIQYLRRVVGPGKREQGR